MNASTTTSALVPSRSSRRPRSAGLCGQARRARARRDAQVQELLPFVERIAKRVSRDIRGKIEMDELVAWGVTGLLEAIDRYQEGGEATLKTYAYYRIRGSMLDNIGKIAPLTRSGYRCAAAAGDHTAIYRSSLNEELIANEDESSPEEKLSQRQQYQVLGRAMQCLSSDHRHMLEQHYFADQSLKDAGGALGKSKSWACRSHAAALDALRQAFESSQALVA